MKINLSKKEVEILIKELSVLLEMDLLPKNRKVILGIFNILMAGNKKE